MFLTLFISNIEYRADLSIQTPSSIPTFLQRIPVHKIVTEAPDVRVKQTHIKKVPDPRIRNFTKFTGIGANTPIIFKLIPNQWLSCSAFPDEKT